MKYNLAFEKLDYGRIDKLNNLHNLETYWNDVRKLTKRVESDHAINRWEALADYRYFELVSEKENK